MLEDTIIIENIKIEWYYVGGSKAILKRISNKEVGGITYYNPYSFEESEIWYYSK